MKTVSQLISELQQIEAKYGDIPIFGRYQGLVSTYNLGRLNTYSRHTHVEMELDSIQPRTQGWIDYCNIVNN
jgi:hypothetical protein